MPILGIMASQISGHLWAPEGAYDALATVTLSAATASVTFSGIPSGYKHLQIRLIASSASGSSYLQMKVNGDTTAANYASHYLYATGVGVSAGGGSSRIGDFGLYPTSSTIYAGGIIDLLDYTSVSKNKTIRNLNGYDANGSGQVSLNSQLWMNSSTPITSLSFNFDNSANITANSQFALYGVK
jgi:hypothetical protein